MKKFIVFILLIVVSLCANYPTVPRTFGPTSFIPIGYLNQNFTAANSVFTSGLYKVNFAELYINNSLFIDSNKNMTMGNMTITGNLSVQGNFNVTGNISATFNTLSVSTVNGSQINATLLSSSGRTMGVGESGPNMTIQTAKGGQSNASGGNILIQAGGPGDAGYGGSISINAGGPSFYPQSARGDIYMSARSFKIDLSDIGGGGIYGDYNFQGSSYRTSLYKINAASLYVDGIVSTNSNIYLNSGVISHGKQIVSPNSGTTVNVSANVEYLILKLGGTLASLTINMTVAPIDGQELAISSTQIITTLAIRASSGATIYNAPTTFAAAGGKFRMIYDLSSNSWYITD
jgi:hypothetical protein